jgi:hypothetical protein
MCRWHDSGPDQLHYLLNGSIGFFIDLVQILPEAIYESSTLLTRACHREVAISLIRKASGVALALGVEPIDRVARLLCSDARRFGARSVRTAQ